VRRSKWLISLEFRNATGPPIEAVRVSEIPKPFQFWKGFSDRTARWQIANVETEGVIRAATGEG
jgi:hypothetical protein